MDPGSPMADRHAKVSNACLDALEGLPHTFPPYSYDEHSSEVIHSTGIEESGQSFLQTRVDPEVYETQSYIDSFHDSPAIVERFPDHFVSLDDQQFACNDAFRGDTINGPAWSAACVDALACTSATLRTHNNAVIYSAEPISTRDDSYIEQVEQASDLSIGFVVCDTQADATSYASAEPNDLILWDEHTQPLQPDYVTLSDLDVMRSQTEYEDMQGIEWYPDDDRRLVDSYPTPATQPRSEVGSDLPLGAPPCGRSQTAETVSGSQDSKTKCPQKEIDPIKKWLYDHPHDPYPTTKEKAELAAAAGITALQLRRRLINLRGRDKHVLDRLCSGSPATSKASTALQGQSTSGTAKNPGRKGKRRYQSRASSAVGDASMMHVAETPNDNKVKATNKYHCTQCESKSFKDSYSWRRHETGVHHFGGTRWYCMLNNQHIMAGGKCVFCSDIIDDVSHINQHNVQICMGKDKDARVFYRKDGLKQHVISAHLHTANDYTKRGFKPPKAWSETEDRYSPDPEGLWCGFCQRSFKTTAVRMDHVEQHFEDGFRMSAWVSRMDAYKRTVA
ncbi:hypothetical protein CC77DRAFT_1053405 [Alternaria alternata]|uniref:C2H2-type domain-containing protein n=1 Tax=Alternaria alternata TaxID=5599 RepID=A0A177DA82_ALTAL|nr:hypothetical protein CC77DRAFT_1053405 [Alternaria alternata]OAG16191.1 hypothetical protein CC77DRAFT_1053405 [Alternaria alternata]